MEYGLLDTTLKYLTGILPTQYGDPDPIFRTPTSNTNDLKDKLEEQFTYGYQIDSHVMQGVDAQGNGTGNVILYGNYKTTQNGQYTNGFICILDSNCNLIQIITSYKSGTQFGEIKRIDVGDDGNYYGVETVNGTKRFIMLNNISVKFPTDQNYNVVLRQSYNLSGASQNLVTISNIIKNPIQGKYLIVGLSSSNKLTVTELTINVGASNDWNDFICNTEFTIPNDAIATWDNNGNVTFKICGTYIYDYAYCHYAEFNGGTSQGSSITFTDYGVITQYDMFNSAIPSFTESYIATREGKIYRVKNGEVDEIKSVDSYPLLFRIGNEVFSSYIKDSKTYIARIIDNHVYGDTIYNGSLTIDFFLVQKQFNLYNYFVQHDNVSYKTQEIYNVNNYNGLPYLTNEALNQNSGVLVNDNDILFARNLYNKVESSNVVTSTINVPNTFANDVYIGNSKLYGKTNVELMDDERPLIKNIYEELMLNYIQSMFMVDKNNSNSPVENANGAIRLNHSVSIENDYNDAKLTKYKIYYDDNTSEVKPFGNNRTIVNGGVLDDYACKTTYYIHVYNPSNKSITKIELISNDEETTYLTIDCSNMQNNKWYKISQDVKINSEYRRI